MEKSINEKIFEIIISFYCDHIEGKNVKKIKIKRFPLLTINEIKYYIGVKLFPKNGDVKIFISKKKKIIKKHIISFENEIKIRLVTSKEIKGKDNKVITEIIKRENLSGVTKEIYADYRIYYLSLLKFFMSDFFKENNDFIFEISSRMRKRLEKK